MERNQYVEDTAKALVRLVDDYSTGKKTPKPTPDAQELVDIIVDSASPSVRLAKAFFLFYSIQNKDWDCTTVPVGIRGKYGDKLISEELTKRDIQFHQKITAFAENLGWKGNVRGASISNDPRFNAFSTKLKWMSQVEKENAAELLAARIFDTRYIGKPLPPLAPDVLSFARARSLFYKLLLIQSSGHIPQLLIAALLTIFRRRYQVDVRTHRPHGADLYEETAGDIEEWQESRLIRAYEVTMRPDWKLRLENFRSKMERYGLSKYTIIAANVETDIELREPARMLQFLEPFGKDLAVIDINDFCDFMAMELTPEELRESVNYTYDLLKNPAVSGRPEYIEAFRGVVRDWLTN